MKTTISRFIHNTRVKYITEKWSIPELIIYIYAVIMENTKINPEYFYNLRHKAFKRKWMKCSVDGKKYFDFNGAKLPDVSAYHLNMTGTLRAIFNDVFLFPCLYDDNYDSKLVEKLDKLMGEGPYGYTDNQGFDVTVKSGDIVVDAGAWIGDFSAYASSKGATAYAFEPAQDMYEWLCQTAQLNTTGKIIPVKKGLGNKEEELKLQITGTFSSSDSFIHNNNSDSYEIVRIVTIDSFVKENNLPRVDFIKSDIEGMERNLLMGATDTMKKFAPKLAICTYHLPDDPEVLEKIIKEANPDYTVMHTRHKLFAMVMK